MIENTKLNFVNNSSNEMTHVNLKEVKKSDIGLFEELKKYDQNGDGKITKNEVNTNVWKRLVDLFQNKKVAKENEEVQKTDNKPETNGFKIKKRYDKDGNFIGTTETLEAWEEDLMTNGSLKIFTRTIVEKDVNGKIISVKKTLADGSVIYDSTNDNK